MTTPTKEQIEKVMSKSCEGVMVCQNCQYQGQCFAMAKKFITEWEKIRNSDKYEQYKIKHRQWWYRRKDKEVK